MEDLQYVTLGMMRNKFRKMDKVVSTIDLRYREDFYPRGTVMMVYTLPCPLDSDLQLKTLDGKEGPYVHSKHLRYAYSKSGIPTILNKDSAYD